MTDTATRVTREEALHLLTSAPLHELLSRADAVRRSMHGARTHYTSSLNLNPSNICSNRCGLCAFWRDEDSPESYFMDLPAAAEQIEAARGKHLTEIHVVGGISTEATLAYHERLFRMIDELLPGVTIKGLTAVEIDAMAATENISVGDVLRRLKSAGLVALPGGGAEIFSAKVRTSICPEKISADRWLEIHETAHGLGLPTNATMLFGHIESPEEIVDHLERIRDLQDRTGGFQAFIPIPFHPAGTALAHLPAVSGIEIARVVALARLYLDNVPHLRMLPNYVEMKLLQFLLHCGLDDIGGTSFDEKIAAAASAEGKNRFVSREDMERFIRELGFEPVVVDSLYNVRQDGSSLIPRQARDERDIEMASTTIRSSRACRGTHDSLTALAAAKAKAGERLTAEEGLALAEKMPLHELGAVADAARARYADPTIATFVIDRNISLTNVCVAECRFCAFHVTRDSSFAFTLTPDEVLKKVKEAEAAGATQVLIQGGLNPDLKLSFYEELFRRIKAETSVWLHSLSPAEISFLATTERISIDETLSRLKSAGLDSLPGGGSEILVDDVRREVSPAKIRTAGWFEVMRAGHRLGMKGTATMVYGLGETMAQRLAHFLRVREFQDETGFFTAFIPWSFQPGRTKLTRNLESGPAYLRVVALARLMIDNVPHVQAGWVTEGPDLAQIALRYGADDFGGVLMEEKVVRETGVAHELNASRLIELIKKSGLRPAQRDTLYNWCRALTY